ncbi:MAG: 23S rRNA (adenine(2503)-C(2))-methyltransferase RlmN [bacterium]|jgi:23S rRNA (adenine2503-C2)-methyltransferase
MLELAEREKSILIGKTKEELSQWVQELGLPAFRGKQLAQWIYQRSVTEFSAMTDLPKAVREQLEAAAEISRTEIASELHSTDGVEKLLLKLHDDQIIETVMLPYEDRVSCCISTQVGCPMGCSFCATGQGGYTRNLTAGEMVEQVLIHQRLSQRRISHVVYMGMGEPLLNYENVIKSVHLLNDELGIGMRHVAISTVGIVPKIKELAKLRLQLTLAISLHAADDELRERIMRVSKKWSIADLMAACKEYIKFTGRKVTFEYLMLSEINDTEEQAKKLAKLVRGIQSVVNLIPFNYVDNELGYKRPSNDRIKAFRGYLENLGVNVTQRLERGQNIAGACGQLKGQHMAQKNDKTTSVSQK